MGKTASSHKRKTLLELIFISAITMTVLGIFIAIQDIVESFARDTGIHILLRTATMALMQFSTAGLSSHVECVVLMSRVEK